MTRLRGMPTSRHQKATAITKLAIPPRRVPHRPGLFTLLEIVPAVSLVLVMAGILYFVLDPIGNIQDSRNASRKGDIILLADAIAEYMRDEGRGILIQVPSSFPGIEICADVQTNNCSGKLSLNTLIGDELNTIPRDPSVEDDSSADSSESGYFIKQINDQRFKIYAPNTEPSGAEYVKVIR